MATIGVRKRTGIWSWNTRTMLEASRLSQVLREMAKYKLDLLGLSEKRWNDSGEFTATLGEMLLYSGRTNVEKPEYGVSLILSKDLRKSLIEWTAISERLIAARLVPVCANLRSSNATPLRIKQLLRRKKCSTAC